MILTKEIYEILEEEGYDLSKISEDELNNLQDEFEDDMENFIIEYIKEHSKELSFEYAGRLGITKKNIKEVKKCPEKPNLKNGGENEQNKKDFFY